jgi:hypothetical protein
VRESGRFTIFLALIRDWGPSRAGLYVFVSVMLLAAFLAMTRGE